MPTSPKSAHSAEPPSVAELAEQTRRSAPPPPTATEDRAFMEGFEESDLRYPFDSILPATLDSNALDESTPQAAFDLVNGRPSSFGWTAPPRAARAPHVAIAALAGLVALSLLAVAAPRFRVARVEPSHRSMTPAQAASWAAASFTVDVPLESSSEPNRWAPVPRDVEPPRPLPHFDLEAAAVALAEAKSSLSECEDSDQRTAATSARVAVTFSPKGSVTAVEIDPASEIEPLPPCVVDRLRTVRVAAFAGPGVTVRTTVVFHPTGAHP